MWWQSQKINQISYHVSINTIIIFKTFQDAIIHIQEAEEKLLQEEYWDNYCSESEDNETNSASEGAEEKVCGEIFRPDIDIKKAEKEFLDQGKYTYVTGDRCVQDERVYLVEKQCVM